MKLARPTQLLALTMSCCVVAFAQVTPPTAAKAPLQTSLDKLDVSSATFTSAVATFKKDLFTKVVNDHELQDGTTYVIRTKGKVDEVGIKITSNGIRTIVYSGKTGEARDFQPNLGCYNSYSAAKSKGTIDSLLALSFGASGKELFSNWTITDKGSSPLDSDAKVTVEKFELIPRDPGLKDNIKMIELWTDLSTAISYKQVVHAPDGDTTTLTLSSVQRNKTPDKGQFDIKGKPCSK